MLENSKSLLAQMNMRGVFLHVLADALGSVVVIISALIMWQTEWEYKIYVDPALSLLLVCIMMKVGNAALCGWGTPNRNIVLDFDKTSCLFLLLSLCNVQCNCICYYRLFKVFHFCNPHPTHYSLRRQVSDYVALT